MPSGQLSSGDAAAIQFFREFDGENHGIAECFRAFGSDSVGGSLLMMVKPGPENVERLAIRGAKLFRACLPANFRLPLSATVAPYACMTIITTRNPFFAIPANFRQR